MSPADFWLVLKEYQISGGALSEHLEQAIGRVVSKPSSRIAHRADVARIMRLEMSAFLFLIDEYNRSHGNLNWGQRFDWFRDKLSSLRLWLDKPAKLRKVKRNTKAFLEFEMSDSSDEEHRGPVGSLKELLNETTFVMGGQDREGSASKEREVEVVCAGSTTHVSETTEEEEPAGPAVRTSTPVKSSPRVVGWSLSPIRSHT